MVVKMHVHSVMFMQHSMLYPRDFDIGFGLQGKFIFWEGLVCFTNIEHASSLW